MYVRVRKFTKIISHCQEITRFRPFSNILQNARLIIYIYIYIYTPTVTRPRWPEKNERTVISFNAPRTDVQLKFFSGLFKALKKIRSPRFPEHVFAPCVYVCVVSPTDLLIDFYLFIYLSIYLFTYIYTYNTHVIIH